MQWAISARSVKNLGRRRLPARSRLVCDALAPAQVERDFTRGSRYDGKQSRPSKLIEEAPMAEAPVRVERQAGYRVITLNRPQQLNAFNEAMHQALKSALAEAEEDSECRALLLTGAGRAFCAGQDLRERMSADGQVSVLGSALETYYNPLVRKLRTLPFPVVAAVNGVAAGAGANIALACDIVLAARSATFIQAFARIGLVPDSGGTWFLPRLIGPARARGLAFTAAPLSAEKAEAWGLIWRMVEDLELMAEAHKLCVHFSEAPTVALALIKRVLDESWDNDLDTQLDLERETQHEASLTPDYAEGVRAFLGKRPPAFSGRRGG
jgi:2-(1,2-epoxy-1,2-dihydrophenyl)acetyl-CoA isomerase